MRIIVLIFILLAAIDLSAQTPKRVIVEHFTNTVCSICTSRNPGFYSNLDNQSNVLHIAYHPSSPYSSCLFNMQNPAENDDRTNYYGIYGSTPKLVIQGENVPVSADYSDPSIFEGTENQLSALSIDIIQMKVNGDIDLNITVSNSSIDAISNAAMFVGIAEDIVSYNAPNGENVHFDVFRKALTNTAGDDFNLAGGASQSINFSVTSENEWNYDELYAYIIIQDAATKEVIQTSATNKLQNDMTIGINNDSHLGLSIYPNPASQILHIDFESAAKTQIIVYDISGSIVLQQIEHENTLIDVANLSTGTYLLAIENSKGKAVQKFIKQ